MVLGSGRLPDLQMPASAWKSLRLYLFFTHRPQCVSTSAEAAVLHGSELQAGSGFLRIPEGGRRTW